MLMLVCRDQQTARRSSDEVVASNAAKSGPVVQVGRHNPFGDAENKSHRSARRSQRQRRHGYQTVRHR